MLKISIHLDASLHRLGHGLPGDDARGLQADTEPLAGSEGTLAINGVAQGINDPAETLHADRDVDDGTGPLHDIALDRELVKKGQRLCLILQDRN